VTVPDEGALIVKLVECRPDLDVHVAHELGIGDSVEISGTLVTIRDATARRLHDLYKNGRPLPIDLRGKLLYAVGPSPPKPGQVVGSAGPTTTERFVSYLPFLFEAGARGIIGKGELHGDIVSTFAAHRALYFAAIGGLGALLGKHVTAAEVVAFPELGPEALSRFEVTRFPAVVIIDATGANYHDVSRRRWRRDAS
jgi:fumarate hydratase subunit beta